MTYLTKRKLYLLSVQCKALYSFGVGHDVGRSQVCFQQSLSHDDEMFFKKMLFLRTKFKNELKLKGSFIL